MEILNKEYLVFNSYSEQNLDQLIDKLSFTC